jgi:hypothetical protein
VGRRSTRERDSLDDASRNIDEGELNLARRHVGPLAAAGNGEALWLMSMFGAPGESNVRFESRRVA